MYKLSLLCLLFCTINGYSQNYEPLELTQKVFSRKGIPHLKKYCTDEYKGRPNGKDFPKGALQQFVLLDQTEKTAVVCMTLNKGKNGIDTYLHLLKEQDTWKIAAFRSLAMTGFIYSMKRELESLSPAQVDSLISDAAKNPGEIHNMFGSRQQYDFMLGNANLTLALDTDIILHFKKHKEEFIALKNLAEHQLATDTAAIEEGNISFEQFKSDYHKLLISSMHANDWDVGGNGINFIIGGMVDNAVGYVYFKNKKDVPKMSPDRLIMLREIGDGWYIYKTT